MNHAKSRGKPNYTVSVLIACDLASGGICCAIVPDSTMVNVIKALKVIDNHYRFPSRIISDAGSSIASLSSHPKLISQLTSANIELVSLPLNHQFANTVEMQIDTAKKILGSLKEDPNQSIYRQNQTVEELMGKMFSVEAVLNSRPILIIDRHSNSRVITPKQLLSPYLSPPQLRAWATDVLSPVFSPAETASWLSKNSQLVLSGLQEALLAFLQSDGIKFRTVMGNESKPDTRRLLPNVNDLVLFKTEKSRKFGIIVQVTGNICKVKTHYYNQVTILEKHCRVLTLLFRASEWNQHGIPVDPPPGAHDHDFPEPPPDL